MSLIRILYHIMLYLYVLLITNNRYYVIILNVMNYI